MKISEILTMQKYWEDSRFNYKKPIMNGSLIGMYGDNIYHKRDVKGKWLQEDSHHSKEDGIVNQQNLERDLSGENVLISNEFVYLGKKSFLLPPKYRMNICKTGPGYKKDALDSELAESLIQEIVLNYGLGVKSIPNQMTTNFKRYNGK